MRSVLSFLLLALGTPPALCAELRGEVVSVHDGDTLSVRSGGSRIRVRLAEIDAPELNQPFGADARRSLSGMCLGKPIVMDTIRHEADGTLWARARCAGLDVNAAQVERGFAWVYQPFDDSTAQLYYLQSSAELKRRGLWSSPSPAPPWFWRTRNR